MSFYKFLRIFSIFSFIVIGIFFSALFVDEIIRVNQHLNEYPFGEINNNPWYYKTKTTYIIYSLVNSILFGISALIIALGFIRRKNKVAFIGMASIIILIVYEFIVGFSIVQD